MIDKNFDGLLKIQTEEDIARAIRLKGKNPFGKWKVYKDGTMVHDEFYEIGPDQLTQDDWILHLMEKTWIDLNTFIPAYLKALCNAKIGRVTILTDYGFK